MLFYSQKNFVFQKLSCLTFLPRFINKRYFFFFTLQLLFRIRGKAILKTGTTSRIASVVSRFYQFFIYLGLDVQHRFPYRSTNLGKPKFPNEKISHGIQHPVSIFVSYPGKEISSFCPDISARETPWGWKEDEIRSEKSSRIEDSLIHAICIWRIFYWFLFFFSSFILLSFFSIVLSFFRVDGATVALWNVD